jgi:hypothetical protein
VASKITNLAGINAGGVKALARLAEAVSADLFNRYAAEMIIRRQMMGASVKLDGAAMRPSRQKRNRRRECHGEVWQKSNLTPMPISGDNPAAINAIDEKR